MLVRVHVWFMSIRGFLPPPPCCRWTPRRGTSHATSCVCRCGTPLGGWSACCSSSTGWQARPSPRWTSGTSAQGPACRFLVPRLSPTLTSVLSPSPKSGMDEGRGDLFGRFAREAPTQVLLGQPASEQWWVRVWRDGPCRQLLGHYAVGALATCQRLHDAETERRRWTHLSSALGPVILGLDPGGKLWFCNRCARHMPSVCVCDGRA